MNTPGRIFLAEIHEQPGAIRSLSYADGHLVLQLQKLDPLRLSEMQRDLQRKGLVAIAAPTASGARLRVGID